MGKFRLWLEFQSERQRDLQKVWQDTFNALGLGGLPDEDAAQQSLSKITFGSRSPDGNRENTFKGKQAARKRLENGQIFAQLQKLGDPELRKNVEDTRRWLDTQTDGANSSTTVSNLLKMLFGHYFDNLINSDFPKVDQAKAQVQPQPPKPEMGQGEPSPDNSMDMNTPQPNPLGVPMGNMPGQQPQAPGNFLPQRPTNPLPPKPGRNSLV